MTSSITQTCPLCHEAAKPFSSDNYFLCPECGGLFLDRHLYVDTETEKARYETHNNDVDDPRYRKFVSPITLAVLDKHTADDTGLDYGAGTGPVISVVLQERGYRIKQYDPFFHPYPDLLKSRYDYIACCEVIEHFHQPDDEFERLKSLLKKGGNLFCMTDLYYPEKDFENWYYKSDPTHVFFYQQRTFEWIKKRYGFSSVTINGRLIHYKC